MKINLTTFLICSSLLTGCASYHMPEVPFISSAKPSIHNSNDSKDLADIAKNAFTKNNYDEAVKLYADLTKQFPANRNFQLNYGDSLRLKGDFHESINVYNKIIDSSSEPDTICVDALEGKSLSLIQLGNFDQALESFKMVIAEDATRSKTINALGVLLTLTNHPKEAMEYYNMAMSIADNHTAVLNNLGLAYAFNGNIREAIVTLEKALFTIKNDERNKRRIALNLALVYGIGGRLNDAEKVSRPYLTEDEITRNLEFYSKLASNQSLAKKHVAKTLVGANKKG